jgi:DNA primase
MAKLNFQELIEKINEVPLSTIVSLRVNLTQKGRHFVGLCPFHQDHTEGSFSVNDEKHIAKCFSCDDGVNDGISFIAKVDKTSRSKAIIIIAKELGFISEKDAQSAGIEGINNDAAKLINKVSIYREANKTIADADIINMVYKLISSEGNKLDGGKDVLTKEHRDYLHSRNISDEDIKKNGYFTMPSRRAVVKIVKKLSIFDFKNEDLKYIPGFYLAKDRNFMTLRPYKGIGIPIKNIDGKIVAIQCRRDGDIKPGEQRYFWWSSASEQLGASPGSPIDVIRPQIAFTSAVFVTEGHFKADILVKKYKCPAISVQGVGNWKQIPKELKKFNVESVYIAYDADMAYNMAVMDQAIKLGDAIKEKYSDMKIFYIVWDFNIGKGIDDFLLTGNKPKRLSFDAFKNKCDQMKEINSTDKDTIYKEYKRIFLEK